MEQRKILFKAKRLDNAEWVEGSLLISEKGRTCIGAMLDPDEKKNNSPVCFSCREVDPSTVCQFTGLKDMKGTPVYENDIIQDPYLKVTQVIVWNEPTCQFFPREIGLLIRSLGWIVIGNKLDRKEEK